jgi:hypothetical protein
MNYQEIITPEQQQRWFDSINNLRFNYFMIHYQGEKIGLLNDKNIDWDNRTSESGIFLGVTEYYNTFVPYLVSVAGIESTFYLLGWKKQYAHILRSNTNAIRFNLQLGYQLCEGQEDIDNQLYEMTWDSFTQKAGKVRKAVRSLAGADNKSRVLFVKEDYDLGLAQRFEDLLKASPHQVEHEVTEEGIWYCVAEQDEKNV